MCLSRVPFYKFTWLVRHKKSLPFRIQDSTTFLLYDGDTYLRRFQYRQVPASVEGDEVRPLNTIRVRHQGHQRRPST